MKKISVIFGLVLAVVLVFSIALPVNAASIVNEKQVPVSGSFFLPNGDQVDYEGYLHFKFNGTSDKAGGFHLVLDINSQNIKGVDTVTGDLYNIIFGVHGNLNVKPPYPFEGTLVANGKAIGQGQAQNFDAHANFHLTVNANGNVTADVENIFTNF